MIQICSGITSDRVIRVLNGELYAQRLQVNLSTFAYRLFHEDFNLILEAKYSGISYPN